MIATAVGDRGLICQLLGPKFGGFVVYGSLRDSPVPGWPSLVSIRQVYKPEYLNPDTKIFGLISNPVGHSKGPLLHNPALRYTGYNGIYVPMLVDNIKKFFQVYSSSDFAGFRLPNMKTRTVYNIHAIFLVIFHLLYSSCLHVKCSDFLSSCTDVTTFSQCWKTV